MAAEEFEQPVQIGILPVPGFALMSYACVVEPLRAANHLSRRRLYDVVHVEGAESSVGAVAPKVARVGDDLRLRMLFVVAGGEPNQYQNPALIAWLRRLSRQGVILCGISGGPVILAHAGLMDGRRMTVHWEHASALSEYDERLLIERSLYVIDRDRVTCAGGTAPLDLMHAIIAQDHGSVLAQLVSDWFLHTDIRPSSGAQRAGLVERVGTTSAPILAAVEAMENHVADPLGLSDLGMIAGVSARQLGRLFQDRLGIPPMGYYRNLRLAVAERLLTGSAMPLTEIALATGFASSSHFARVYAGQFGRPPSQARR